MTYVSWRNRLERQLQSYSDFFYLIPDFQSRDKMLEEMVRLKAVILMVDNLSEYDSTSEVPLFEDTRESIMQKLTFQKCLMDLKRTDPYRFKSRINVFRFFFI